MSVQPTPRAALRMRRRAGDTATRHGNGRWNLRGLRWSSVSSRASASPSESASSFIVIRRVSSDGTDVDTDVNADFNAESGMLEISANVLKDSMEELNDLPTVPA